MIQVSNAVDAADGDASQWVPCGSILMVVRRLLGQIVVRRVVVKREQGRCTR